MKTECREIAAHFLNLFLANFEAIGAVGNYILEIIDDEDCARIIKEIDIEADNLFKAKLISEAEDTELWSLTADVFRNIQDGNYLEVKEALDQIGKKAFNKMFESVVICECGDPGIPEPRKGGRN